MPQSVSIWQRLFGWLRRTPDAPAAGPGVSAMPVPPVTPSSAPVQPAPATPIIPSPPPPFPSPATPSAPSPLPSRPELPREGVNLGFRRIWNNHPAISDHEIFPCRSDTGLPNFENQCGILMGTCLLRSELLHGYDKSVCWFRGHRGHTLRAREVADWMRRHPERFGKVEIRRNVTWGAFVGRTGFICFHNFWGVGNQGDHIDLWDGTGILRRENDPLLEGPGLADGALDYFERSEEVWFWPTY